MRLRVLRHEAARDRRGLHRFLTLNRLVAEIEHEFLPREIEAGNVEGRFYVAHELVDGETLAARVARTGPLHISDARPLLRAVLEALGALHERRIAHGDLRLENVVALRTSDGALRVVLLDAGSDRLRARPRVLNGRNELFSTAASPKTASPEQIRGIGSDPRSDVYSFGAMAFELLTGKPPFGENALESAFGHLTREPPRASSIAPRGFVTPEVDDLLLKLLDKEPSTRPADAQAVLTLLDVAQYAPSILPPMSADEVDGLIERLKREPTNESCAMQLESSAEGAPERIATAFLEAAAAVAADQPETKKALLFRAGRILSARKETLGRAEEVYKDLVALDPDRSGGVRQPAGDAAQARQVRGARRDAARAERARREPRRTRAPARGNRAHLRARDARHGSGAGRIHAGVLRGSEPDEHREQRSSGSRARAPRRGTTSSRACTEAAQGEGVPQEAKIALLLSAARLYESKLQRPDLALPCFQAVVAVDPANDAALDGMAKIYRKAQQWTELGAILVSRADASASPARARDLRAEAADILETYLGDGSGARAMVEQILADDPAHVQANDQLARLCERSGDHAGVVKVLERRAAALRGDEKLRILCRIAEIHELNLNDDAGAQKRYEAVLDEDSKNTDALRGLDRLFSKAGRFQDLLSNLNQQIEAAATPRQKIALWERSAAIHEEEFLNHEKAAHALEQVLAIDPNYENALSGLVRHQKALGQLGRRCGPSRKASQAARRSAAPPRRVAPARQGSHRTPRLARSRQQGVRARCSKSIRTIRKRSKPSRDCASPRATPTQRSRPSTPSQRKPPRPRQGRTAPPCRQAARVTR